MSETDAYFAGLIDGEGNVALNSRGPNRPGGLRPVIKVKMTDKAIIEALAETYGGTVRPRPAANPNCKDQWFWKAENRACRETLNRIYPYLRVKRADAEKLLAYFATTKRGRPKK